ncbi:hypothetical protein LX36DRAFT_339330 [Colletotrichum falcatum]|nr:hypothetical protein LX36DRAFT_339330 [Colletotrichum falcatum]
MKLMSVSSRAPKGERSPEAMQPFTSPTSHTTLLLLEFRCIWYSVCTSYILCALQLSPFYPQIRIQRIRSMPMFLIRYRAAPLGQLPPVSLQRCISPISSCLSRDQVGDAPTLWQYSQPSPHHGQGGPLDGVDGPVKGVGNPK